MLGICASLLVLGVAGALAVAINMAVVEEKVDQILGYVRDHEARIRQLESK